MSDNNNGGSQVEGQDSFSNYVNSDEGSARLEEAGSKGIKTSEEEYEELIDLIKKVDLMSYEMDRRKQDIERERREQEEERRLREQDSFRDYDGSNEKVEERLDEVSEFGILTDEEVNELDQRLGVIWKEFLISQRINIANSIRYLKLVGKYKNYAEYDATNIESTEEYKESKEGFDAFISSATVYFRETLPKFMSDNETSIEDLSDERDCILNLAIDDYDYLLHDIFRFLQKDNVVIYETGPIRGKGIFPLGEISTTQVPTNYLTRNKARRSRFDQLISEMEVTKS